MTEHDWDLFPWPWFTSRSNQMLKATLALKHIKEECHFMHAWTAATCLCFMPKLLKLHREKWPDLWTSTFVIIHIKSRKSMQGQERGWTKEKVCSGAKGEVGKQEWRWALVIAGQQQRITVYKGEKSAGDLRSGCWQTLSSNLLPSLSLFSASLPFHQCTWIFILTLIRALL